MSKLSNISLSQAAAVLAIVGLFVSPSIAWALVFLGAAGLMALTNVLAFQKSALEKVSKVQADDLVMRLESQARELEELSERLARLEFTNEQE